MLKKIAFIISCISISYTVFSQNINEGLVAYFPFDGYPIVDKSGNGNKAIIGGDSTLGCGVEGNAMRFDGLRSEIIFIGPAVFDNFKTGPFSISFYFKASTQAGNSTLDILSKRRKCSSDSSFAIRFTPITNQISVELSENAANRSVILQRLEFARCWQHIVVVREYSRLALYVNGKLMQTSYAPKRVNITNEAPLAFAKSPCLTTTDRKFGGFIDEFRVYDRPLTDDEVALLFSSPDRIANRDTIMFLGSSINVRPTNTCATDFKWTPTTNVDNPTSPTTVITPTRGGTFKYALAMKEQQCTAIDSLEIKVIDPDDLDCGRVYLPKAFSPNGDGNNDEFFISNPYALKNGLIDFDIFDAWGAKMFSTKDKLEHWNGTFGGKLLNPGVYVWKVRYVCKGQELSDFGSVTLIK